MLINMGGFWLGGIPLSLLLGFRLGLGPIGLWWGLAAGLALVALVLLARIRVLLQRGVARVELEPGAVPG
jgi:MATE family multidrug resistance protein